MNPRYNDIDRLAPDLGEALDPDERADLARALAGDPAASRALAHWAALRDRLGADLARDLPPADLLTLYALADEPLALTDDEAARLAAARADLDATVAGHPGLEAVVEGIREDRDAFYALFEERPAGARRTARPDRPAVPRARQPVRRWGWRIGVAAALVLFAVAAGLLLQRDAGFDVVRTASGETRTVTLGDGSVVHLAERTTLEHRVDAETRVVRLTGEAVFEVTPGERRFVVETAAAITTVLGTTFGVTADARATEVVLAHGSVALEPRGRPAEVVRLAPGERSRVVAGQAPETPLATDVAATLAWTGTWYFQATPLAEIAERLSVHYDVPIRVPAGLARERVTGAFARDVPVEETLRTLASALGTRIVRDADGGFRFEAAGG